MGQETGIAWTDGTANFWWGCQRVSPGCERCYAEQLAVTRRKLPVWGPPSTTERVRMKGIWRDVVRWNDEAAASGVRKRVFVSSMADAFEDHPQVAPWRAEALALLATLTSLDVQLLTKRPANILRMVPPAWLTSWPAHVWVGCTVEDQRRAAERIPHLLAVPARVRFLSVEPLLEAVNLTRVIERVIPGGPPGEVVFDALRGWCGATEAEDTPAARGLQWVIVGGESGPGARTFDMQWARVIVAQCKAAGVPVFVKQMGANAVDSKHVDVMAPGGKRVAFRRDAGDPTLDEARRLGRELRPMACDLRAPKGDDQAEWPNGLRVQEFPRE